MNIFKTLFTSTFLLIAGITFSQTNVGFKTGLNYGNFTLEDDQFPETIKGENMIGFETGFYSETHFSDRFYFKPELLYTYRYGNATNRGNSGLTTHRLGLPLMLGFDIAGPVSIEAGPSIQYMLYFDQGFAETAVVSNNALIGYRIGPKVNFGRVSAYANFQGFAFDAGSKSDYNEPFRINAGVAVNLCSK